MSRSHLDSSHCGRSMRAASIVAALLCVLVSAPVCLGGAIAYDYTPGQVGNQAFGGELGNQFTVNVPIRVTSVGVFDDQSNGIVGTLNAQIWEISTTSVVPGTTMTFDNAAQGTLTAGSVRLKPLPTPVVLSPGDYYIASNGHSPTDANLNYNSGAFPFTIDDGGGLVTINAQAGVVSKAWGNPAGTFPSTPDGDFMYGGGTFEFEAVQPASGLLNGSFEAPPQIDHTVANGSPFTNVMPGWLKTGNVVSAGIFNPADNHYAGATDQDPDLDTTIPDGRNVAFINPNGAAIYQETLDTLQTDTIYNVSAWMGDRVDAPGGSSTYRLSLSAGGALLGAVDGAVSDGFLQAAFPVAVGLGHPQLGSNLEVRVTKVNGVQLNVDDVQLNVAPTAPLTPINILNPSFEQDGDDLDPNNNSTPIGQDPGEWTNGIVPEWDDHFALNPAVGLFHPTTVAAHDGTLVAYMNTTGGSFLVQDLEFADGLPLTAQPGETVIINLHTRLSTGGAGSVRIDLRAGANVPISTPVVLDIPADAAGFTPVTAVFTINDAASLGALLGEPIYIGLDTPLGGQVWLDSVSGLTTMVPEPASPALLALGIAAVALARLRRRLV